jgi:hypothetical protein
VIQAAIAAALAGAFPLPLDGATAMADDFARLCLSQAPGFPGTAAQARADGWSDESFVPAYEDMPTLRDKLFQSPVGERPARSLAVGFVSSEVGKTGNLSCAISATSVDFEAAVSATTARLGRAPAARDETAHVALWKAAAGTRRLFLVGPGLGMMRNGMAIVAVDLVGEPAHS